MIDRRTRNKTSRLIIQLGVHRDSSSDLSRDTYERIVRVKADSSHALYSLHLPSCKNYDFFMSPLVGAADIVSFMWYVKFL